MNTWPMQLGVYQACLTSNGEDKPKQEWKSEFYDTINFG